MSASPAYAHIYTLMHVMMLRVDSAKILYRRGERGGGTNMTGLKQQRGEDEESSHIVCIISFYNNNFAIVQGY